MRLQNVHHSCRYEEYWLSVLGDKEDNISVSSEKFAQKDMNPVRFLAGTVRIQSTSERVQVPSAKNSTYLRKDIRIQ